MTRTTSLWDSGMVSSSYSRLTVSFNFPVRVLRSGYVDGSVAMAVNWSFFLPLLSVFSSRFLE